MPDARLSKSRSFLNRSQRAPVVVCAILLGFHSLPTAAQDFSLEDISTPREFRAEAVQNGIGAATTATPSRFTLPPISEQPAKTAARKGVLVLVDGRVVGGDIEQIAGGYQLTRPRGASETIPSFLVRVSADSIDQAYYKLRDATKAPRPDDHISLAEWCVQQGLFEFARDELAAALKLDSRRDDARALLVKVEAKLNPGKPLKAEEVAPRTADGYLEPVPRTTADLSADVRVEFTGTIQRLMLNKCGNVHCHGSKTETSFQLIAIRSRAASHENLTNTVQWLDVASPEGSPLLTSLTSEAHSRVFVGRAGHTQLAVLRDWVNLAAKDLHAAPSAPDAFAATQPPVIPASGRFRASDASTTPLTKTTEFPVLQPTPEEEIVSQVLKEERPDPFDPEAFNRAMHGPADQSAR